jgi:hypothetical protein
MIENRTMRWVWTEIGDGFYDTLHEARLARRRAIARREVLRKPKPIIVKWRDGSFLLEGRVILKGSWSWSKNYKGAVREQLLGEPVKAPRPIAKRVRKLRICVFGRV